VALGNLNCVDSRIECWQPIEMPLNAVREPS